jgi:cytosine/adenosine deaminase-related metal-dependent hydrolase
MQADIVSLNAEHAALFGRRADAILDSWIFAGGKVDCVWRSGRKIVEDGRHFARDSVAHSYRKAIESVLG